MKNDQGHWVIEDVSDFHGYEIIFHEEYKPGVFKVCIKRDLKEHAKCLTVFSKKQFLPNDVESHNRYWAS